MKAKSSQHPAPPGTGQTRSQRRVPPVFENWLAFIGGKPCLSTEEYPLFTDAHITGQASQGPYQFINTVPRPEPRSIRPAIILRCARYLKFTVPNMTETDAELYHGGSFPEEIAALASLALGVRIRAGGVTRVFDESDPRGTPMEWDVRPFIGAFIRKENTLWILPNVAEGDHSLDELSILALLPNLSANNIIALVRAARLYQDALWLAESEPALAWLMLVSAVETAADQWRKDSGEPADRLRTSKPELYEYLLSLGPEVPVRVAAEIANSLGVTGKFVGFVLKFLPPAPRSRPPTWCQHPWGKHELKVTLGKIYDYRSRALHEGKPFPAPMCEPPFRLSADWPAPAERPIGEAASTGGGTWLAKDTPILLHTFEYLARHALIAWWKQGTPEQEMA